MFHRSPGGRPQEEKNNPLGYQQRNRTSEPMVNRHKRKRNKSSIDIRQYHARNPMEWLEHGKDDSLTRALPSKQESCNPDGLIPFLEDIPYESSHEEGDRRIRMYGQLGDSDDYDHGLAMQVLGRGGGHCDEDCSSPVSSYAQSSMIRDVPEEILEYDEAQCLMDDPENHLLSEWFIRRDEDVETECVPPMSPRDRITSDKRKRKDASNAVPWKRLQKGLVSSLTSFNNYFTPSSPQTRVTRVVTPHQHPSRVLSHRSKSVPARRRDPIEFMEADDEDQ